MRQRMHKTEGIVAKLRQADLFAANFASQSG